MSKTESIKFNNASNNFTCKVCDKECSLNCVNCRKVWYCSRPHQKQDWSSHKKDCFPGQITTNPSFGRYLTATRAISEGSLIFKDKPLFSAPNGKNITFPLCLGCYGVVHSSSSGKIASCFTCGWPMHAECAQNTCHLDYECKIFSKIALTPRSQEENIYAKILVLRGCLLKLNDEKKWKLVKQLQDHREERLKTEDGASDSKLIINFIKIKCGLDKFFTDYEIDHIYGSIVVNAYLAEDDVPSSPNFHAGCFVYWNASLPAHDCSPNCKWTILKGGELRLWALRNIKEGESLTHCYGWGGNGTLERQKHLFVSKFFICTCSRCQDVTEGGSFFSGLKCRDEPCSGFVLSKNPVELGSDWACSLCGGSLTTQAEVEELTQQLRNAHSSITQGCRSGKEIGGEGWRRILQELEDVKEKLFLARVGPSHFLVHEIEQDILTNISYILCQVDGQETETLDWVKMNRLEKLGLARMLITLSKKWISYLDKICPGLTPHYGRQLYYYQQGLGIYIQDQIERQRESDALSEGFPANEVDQETSLRQKITEWQETRRKCLQTLETESPGREDWIMGQAMKIGD